MNNIHALLLAAALSLTSCSVHVEGEQQQRDLAQELGARYAKPFAERELPPLSPDASLADWIAHAEQGHGGLEAKWHEWIAAIEEVPQAATQDTQPMLGIEHTLDGGAALDRTGLMLMTDTMANFVAPGRLGDRGLATLSRARIVGAAFVSARLQLQADVTERFTALALQDREIALQERLVAATDVVRASAAARASAGLAAQRETIEVEASRRRAEARLQRLRAERPALLAALLAIVGSDANSVPDARPSLPAMASLRKEEQDAFACGLAHNPALREAKAAHDAALAQLAADEWERIPQFSLRSLLMGDGSAMLQPAMTLPFFRSHAIDAMLRQRESEVAAAAALLRQAERDAVAELAARERELVAVAAEHELLRRDVAPLLESAVELARREWAAGQGGLDGWLEAATAQLELDRELAQLQATAAIARAHAQHALGEVAQAEGPGEPSVR